MARTRRVVQLFLLGCAARLTLGFAPPSLPAVCRAGGRLASPAYPLCASYADVPPGVATASVEESKKRVLQAVAKAGTQDVLKAARELELLAPAGMCTCTRPLT